jgi:hypothetical protein
MDVYNFLKNRYDAFYDLLERDCRAKGWDISFDPGMLFRDINFINGHEGLGISQYPKVNGEEIIMDCGWRLVFDHGFVDTTSTPVSSDGDETIVLYYKGTFYNPNQVEYPFTYKAMYFWNNAPAEMDTEEENFDYPKGVPEEVIEHFMEIMRDKARWGN